MGATSARSIVARIVTSVSGVLHKLSWPGEGDKGARPFGETHLGEGGVAAKVVRCLVDPRQFRLWHGHKEV